MLTRVLSALVALGIVVPILVFGGVTGVAVLVAFVAVVCQLEFSKMADTGSGPVFRIWDVLGALLIYVSIQSQQWALILVALASVFLGTFFLHLLRLKPLETVANRWAFSVAGFVYIPLCLAFLPLLRDQPLGLDWIYLVLIITWAGDSGAYLAGRAFGRTKLYPMVSPKKTVEGVLGGVALSIVGALVAKATFFPELGYVECFLLAPVADLAGVTGDLCESLLKRSAGVKDSGNIMPGHGGMLDRLDSLIFSGPLVFAYVIFLF